VNNLINNIKYLLIIITFSLIVIPGKTQISEVPCICETSSLQIIPRFSHQRIVIIKDNSSPNISWKYELPKQLIEEEILAERIPEPSTQIDDRPTVSEKSQVPLRNHNTTFDPNRKRLKKKKIRLKRQSIKKYRGQCPFF